MSNQYKVRVTRLSVVPEGEPLFHEGVTHVSVTDEAGGEYLEIGQCKDYMEPGSQKILIEPAEWPAIREAIDRMVAECETDDTEETKTQSRDEPRT